MTICFRSVIYFIMCASLVEVKSCRNAYFIGYFNFCSKWSLLKNVSFSVDVLSFLKKKHLLFCQYQFLAQKLSILDKKIWNVWRNVDFFLSFLHYYWKRLSFGKTCFFLEKCAFFEGLYTLTTRLILIKISIFLRIC